MKSEPVPLVILEARLAVMDCLEVIRALKEQAQPAGVIVLTRLADPFVRQETAQAGADGCVVKPCSLDLLLVAMKAVCLGVRVAWKETGDVNQDPRSNFGLTLVQQLILRHLVVDRTIQQAAEALGLQVSTINSHLGRLRRRFGVHTAPALVNKVRIEFPGVFRQV